MTRFHPSRILLLSNAQQLPSCNRFFGLGASFGSGEESPWLGGRIVQPSGKQPLRLGESETRPISR